MLSTRMGRLRWGIVGVGRAGRARAAALREDPRAELVCGYGGSPEGVGLSEAHSLEALLDQVDAVAICAPDREHPRLVRRSLDEGRFVLCEFPLCQHPEEARELLGSGRLHVEHIELLTPTAQALRGVSGVVSASMAFEGPPRDSWSRYHANIARLHRVLDALGSPRGIELDRLEYDGFSCSLDFRDGAERRTHFVLETATGTIEQKNRFLLVSGRPVDLPSGGGLFLQDQLAASARFLDGAASYVREERVMEALAIARVLSGLSSQ